MDKRKGCVLLLINAGVRSSVSERKNLGGCSITCNSIHKHSNSGPPFSSFGPSRDYGMDLYLEVYL